MAPLTIGRWKWAAASDEARFWHFWHRVLIGDGCWVWLGKRNAYGYGMVAGWRDGKEAFAHRVALELSGIQIPEGMEADHLCRNRLCVRPSHLEPVTHTENVRRGQVGVINKTRFAAMTHCHLGHPFDEENTARYKNRNGTVSRHCKACGRIRLRGYRQRKKEG